MDRIYLDHNATSPLRESAREAMSAAYSEAWGNPDSPHAEGRRARSLLESSRREVGILLGVHPRGLVFTSSASEANTQALSHWARRGTVLVSAVEHPSVLSWAGAQAPVDAQGRVDLSTLDALLGEEPSVLSVMAANNETGVLQPLDEVAGLARTHGVPLHVDATQIPGRAEVQPLFSLADAVTLSSHKLGGPRGVGVLWARDPLDPLVRGGPQERGLRGGTPDVPAIAGFAAALDEALRDPLPEHRALLVHGLEALGARVLGADAACLGNTAAALFEVPGDLLVIGLDLEGVAASTGSACSSGSAQESHVVRAMGLEGTPVRLSTGPDTGKDALRAALDALGRVLQRARGELST